MYDPLGPVTTDILNGVFQTIGMLLQLSLLDMPIRLNMSSNPGNSLIIRSSLESVAVLRLYLSRVAAWSSMRGMLQAPFSTTVP